MENSNFEKNLWHEDLSSKIEDSTKELSKKIQNIFKGKQPASKFVQSELNNLKNYNSYESIKTPNREENIIIKKNIERIFASLHKEEFKSVFNINDFQKSFPTNCMERCWELVCFDRFSKMFSRPSQEKETINDIDLYFEEIMVECTSVSSGRFPDFVKILPDFPILLQILNFLYRKRKNISTSCWHFDLEKIFEELEGNIKKPIHQMLNQIKLPNQHANDIQKIRMIMLALDSCSNYPSLLPKDVVDSLEKIEIDIKSNRRHGQVRTHLKSSDMNFLIQRIIFSLTGKLKQKYFYLEKQKSVIVSITVDSYTDTILSSLTCQETKDLFHGFIKSGELITKIMQKRLFDIPLQESKLRLSNLYALHINTNWYSWFEGVVNWPDDNKNGCDFIIYNKDHAEYGKYIFHEMAAYKGSVSFNAFLGNEESIQETIA